jgi:hypothetical protein
MICDTRALVLTLLSRSAQPLTLRATLALLSSHAQPLMRIHPVQGQRLLRGALSVVLQWSGISDHVHWKVQRIESQHVIVQLSAHPL